MCMSIVLLSLNWNLKRKREGKEKNGQQVQSTESAKCVFKGKTVQKPFLLLLLLLLIAWSIEAFTSFNKTIWFALKMMFVRMKREKKKTNFADEFNFLRQQTHTHPVERKRFFSISYIEIDKERKRWSKKRTNEKERTMVMYTHREQEIKYTIFKYACSSRAELSIKMFI